MLTKVAYVGATFTLVVFLGCLALLTWSIATHQHPILPLVAGATALLTGAMIGMHDWKEIWAPLLFKK